MRNLNQAELEQYNEMSREMTNQGAQPLAQHWLHSEYGDGRGNDLKRSKVKSTTAQLFDQLFNATPGREMLQGHHHINRLICMRTRTECTQSHTGSTYHTYAGDLERERMEAMRKTQREVEQKWQTSVNSSALRHSLDLWKLEHGSTSPGWGAVGGGGGGVPYVPSRPLETSLRNELVMPRRFEPASSSENRTSKPLSPCPSSQDSPAKIETSECKNSKSPQASAIIGFVLPPTAAPQFAACDSFAVVVQRSCVFLLRMRSLVHDCASEHRSTLTITFRVVCTQMKWMAPSGRQGTL